MPSTEHGVKWLSRSQRSSRDTNSPQRPGELRGRIGFVWCVGILQMLSCESKSVIATWSCPPKTDSRLLGTAGTAGMASAVRVAGNAGNAGAAGSAGTAGVAGSAQAAEPLEIPWSTGFENAFCEFPKSCYGTERIVSEPVRSGLYAAAFTIDGAGAGQSRCFLEGTLPAAAHYGAWFYVPSLGRNNAGWNLFHFEGDNPANRGHLWDVTLVENASGVAHLVVFSFLLTLPDQSNNAPIPLDSWFHVEIYLKRASDDSGEVTLYQDGAIIVQLTNIKTDNSSGHGSWHIGNWVGDSNPSSSTLYVDDITIRANR